MRTNVYVDGFNFYYGVVRNTPWKWVDFRALFELALKPHHEICTIKYFTARVSPTERDQSAPERQDFFLQALKHHCPKVEIYFGHFLDNEKTMPLAPPNRGYAKVTRIEEKGSDVNLAVHLLNDAWLDAYECAVVVSNDSDLTEAMRLVRERGKRIGLITPRTERNRKDRRTSKELLRYASFRRELRERYLRKAQMPPVIPGTSIRKPETW